MLDFVSLYYVKCWYVEFCFHYEQKLLFFFSKIKMLFLFEYKRQEFLLFIFHISHMLENVFQSIFMNANKYQKTNCFS